MAVGQQAKTMPILVHSKFYIKLTQNVLYLKFKMIKKNWAAHIWLVGSHALDQNGPPHGYLITWDGNISIKYTPLNFVRISPILAYSESRQNLCLMLRIKGIQGFRLTQGVLYAKGGS